MPRFIEIKEFLELAKTVPVVDVRSPSEFGHGHIPEALNIPLFSDEERAAVGITYKHSGQEPAMLKGLELVGPKLADFARKAKKMAKEGEILLHCWRGGMRSSSMATLFEATGLKTCVLKGGYKAFRHHVLESFKIPLQIMIVGGETGSGKTEILAELKKQGEQIIDLEHLASHKGSSFGAIGLDNQPSTEQFENNLFVELKNQNTLKRIWLEDESRHIGRVFIPDGLWQQMTIAPVMRVQVPFDIRVQRLIIDYGNHPPEILTEALLRIKKRLGGLALKEALEAFEKGDMATATGIALNYYDKAYDYPHQEKKYEGVTFVACTNGDPKENANKILEVAGRS